MKKHLIIIAGPNGSGKSTFAMNALKQFFDIDDFVNADEIAKGIAPLKPESASLEAGKFMIKKINQLITEEKSFAVETTLSGHIYGRIIKDVKKKGYKISLFFFALPKYQIAQKRVLRRVKLGGHNIPPETIKRRYYAGIKNRINQYIAMVDFCLIIDATTSEKDEITLIAEKTSKERPKVYNKFAWELLKEISEKQLSKKV